MAYLREIQVKCCQPGCTSRASVEVVDRFNSSRGRYCKKHGEQRKHDLEKYERDWPTPGPKSA